jgi:mono/diheme cytochrome c family protein
MPVGLKVRNLNISVVRNGRSINQLEYLHKAGIMDDVNPQQFSFLPAWQNEKYSIQDRVRAYLDVNCAHCHSSPGSCARSAVRFAWEMPLAATRITEKNNRIVNFMANGRMPRIGTTIVDSAALALIKQYFQLQ